jgi:hypothetical protein
VIILRTLLGRPQPCRLVVLDDLFNLSRCIIHRVTTVRCLNARNMTMPTKNDSSAITTHPSSVNAKDKRSIRMTFSLVGRTRSPAMDELKYC